MIKKEREICEFEKDFKKSSLVRLRSNLSNDDNFLEARSENGYGQARFGNGCEKGHVLV